MPRAELAMEGAQEGPHGDLWPVSESFEEREDALIM